MGPARPEDVEQQHHLTFAGSGRWLADASPRHGHTVIVVTAGHARKLGTPSGVSVASLWEKEASCGRGATIIQRVCFTICRKGFGHVRFRPSLCGRYLLVQLMGRPYQARVTLRGRPTTQTHTIAVYSRARPLQYDDRLAGIIVWWGRLCRAAIRMEVWLFRIFGAGQLISERRLERSTSA